MAAEVGFILAIAGIIPPALQLIDEISTVVKNGNQFGADAGTLRIRFKDEDETIKSSLSFLFGNSPCANGGIFDALPRTTQQNVLSISMQLLLRLKDYAAIEAKYNLTVLDSTTRGGADDFLKLATLVEENPRERELQSSTSWWRKLHWSTSGKKRLVELIVDLSDWNQRIRRVVQDVIWSGLLTILQVQRVEVNTDAKAMGLGPSATMRRLIMSDESSQDLVIPQHKVKTPGGPCREGDLQVAEIDGTPVIVEYKNYELDRDGDISAVTMKQVRQLTTLLHCQGDSSFRVLPCRGYLNDRARSRFGFVFDVPSGFLPKSLTLDAALNLSSSRSKKPSVTARLQLAHRLSESLYLLHTVGWVHKSLRSESIVFFESSGGSGISYDTPWVLGFEYSRQESDFSSNRAEDRIERNLYRHWERWGKPTVRSTKIHDIYALGVILLEIGLWQSAKTLSKDGFKSHSGDAPYVKNALCKVARGRLGFSMGERYEKLVLMCLEGHEKVFGVENDDKRDTQLQKQFRENVVEALEVASQYI